MPAGLFQMLTGTFKNGVPVDAVSESSRKALTVMDEVDNIINTRTGTLKHLPQYGIPDVLPDTVAIVPQKESKLVAEHMKTYLPVFVPNVKSARLAQWEVTPKGCFCECILICKTKTNAVYRFFVQFRHIGVNTIRPWRGVG